MHTLFENIAYFLIDSDADCDSDTESHKAQSLQEARKLLISINGTGAARASRFNFYVVTDSVKSGLPRGNILISSMGNRLPSVCGREKIHSESSISRRTAS